jgi:hypothetical protein
MIAFIDRAPEFEIRDQVVHISDLDGHAVAMPLRVFRLAQARAMKAVREHDASGEVVPFNPKRRGRKC